MHLFTFLPSPTLTWDLKLGLKRDDLVLWLKHTHALRASQVKQQVPKAPTLVDELNMTEVCFCEPMLHYREQLESIKERKKQQAVLRFASKSK